MEQMAFRIKGMCCAEETTQLKRELGPLVGGELNLAFDLLSNKMTVVASGDLPSEAQIREAVARTGMEAIPWSEACATGICAVEEGLWERHGRLITTIASGILMACGFLLEVRHHGGFLQALLGPEENGAGAPTAAIALYLASVVAGAWYVAPRALFSVRRFQPDMNLLMLVAACGAMA
ncbi:MAG: cation-transporting P-type ATPase, partial [Syntrophobacteraceae bacterium]|nr:cation-transporting P-type ATPase [Syntrophobacteraceae bacterium]